MSDNYSPMLGGDTFDEVKTGLEPCLGGKHADDYSPLSLIPVFISRDTLTMSEAEEFFPSFRQYVVRTLLDQVLNEMDEEPDECVEIGYPSPYVAYAPISDLYSEDEVAVMPALEYITMCNYGMIMHIFGHPYLVRAKVAERTVDGKLLYAVSDTMYLRE